MAEVDTNMGNHTPAGGENGPIFTGENPPGGFEPNAPESFDPGPAIMQAGADAYNEVIEGGGDHASGMQALGGACSEAAGELGIPPQEFNQAMEGFTDGFNTAQMEGGDAPTCINAGFDAADQAVTDGGGEGGEHDYHPPTDVVISPPADFPDPGEGPINPQPPVDMPEGMTHNWEEGAPAEDHPMNTHEEGEPYGPGPELAPPAEAGDMFGDAAPIATDATAEVDMGVAIPVLGDSDFVAPPAGEGLDEAAGIMDAAATAAAVADATAAGDNGVVNDGVMVDGVATASGNTDEGADDGMGG